jgi:ATP-binding cassette subfamily B protein
MAFSFTKRNTTYNKFVLQHDESDCGIACLLSIIKYYNGSGSLERLRELSGTSIQGTSMLGLQQAASIYGLQADAFEVDDIKLFKEEATFPCILHVVIDEKLEHYVVCLNQPSDNKVNIFDPAIGFEIWSMTRLLNNWKSRVVLLFQPTDTFQRVSDERNSKLLWIKNILENDWPLFIIAIVLGIILAILGLSTAIFSQKLLDEILPKHQIQRFWVGICFLTILLFSRAAINYLRTFFLLRQSRDFNNRVLEDFYNKLLHLPQSFFNGRKTGEIIARINDTRRIQSVISFLTGNVVIDLLVILVSTVFLLNYSLIIGLVSLISIPLYIMLVYLFSDKILLNQKLVMKNYANSESQFVDAISGISDIKVANKESFFSKVGTIIYSSFQEKNYDLGLLGNRYGFWNEIINAGLLIGILILSTLSVLNNTIKIGEMMAIITIGSGMIGSVGRLVTTNIQLQEAKVAFERMFEFSSMSPEKTSYDVENSVSGTKMTVNSIDIKNLAFRFPGKSQLLTNVNVTLNKGHFVALIGEVGSGKSIFFQILQKFQEYEKGEIIVNDKISFRDISPSVWRSSIGVVSQDIKIFNSNVLENIVLGDIMLEGESAISFCNEFGFNKFFESFPQGYLTIVGEDGVHLSGGQKQLVALARALFRKPSILILDEATSAMDKKTELFVLDLIEKIKSDCCVIMVTHRSNIENVADNVYMLQDGVSSLVR